MTDTPHTQTEDRQLLTGTCQKCRRASKTLANTGTVAYPYLECGRCRHRRERAINCKEMWGRGRRGY